MLAGTYVQTRALEQQILTVIDVTGTIATKAHAEAMITTTLQQVQCVALVLAVASWKMLLCKTIPAFTQTTMQLTLEVMTAHGTMIVKALVETMMTMTSQLQRCAVVAQADALVQVKTAPT